MNNLDWWWSEHFEYCVTLDKRRVGVKWPSNTFEPTSWLKDQYPHLRGDTGLSRYGSDNTPYYHYDWGFSRMMTDDVIYYFKDRRAAQMFKLVWG